jgi:hypothetical protein
MPLRVIRDLPMQQGVAFFSRSCGRLSFAHDSRIGARMDANERPQEA